MRVVLLFMLLTAIGVGRFFLVSEEKRWIFFNGNDAEIYATQLLNNSTTKTPDKFIDYSVSTNDGYVIFSKHGDHSTIYGYFPVKTPTDIDGAALKVNWEQLDGKWFVCYP